MLIKSTKISSPPRGSNSQPSDTNLAELVWHRLDKSLTLYPIELGGLHKYIQDWNISICTKLEATMI
jgi:hypothetical protein